MTTRRPQTLHEAAQAELERSWADRAKGDDLLPIWLLDIEPGRRLLFGTPFADAADKDRVYEEMTAVIAALKPERVIHRTDGWAVSVAPGEVYNGPRPSESTAACEYLNVLAYERGGDFAAVMRRYRTADDGTIEALDTVWDGSYAGRSDQIAEAMG